MKDPITIVVTGGAGQIAYSLLPPLASGSVFGNDQPVKLHLLDIPPAQTALEGVKMELEDLAYPLLAGVVGTDDPALAFKGADYAVFLGAFPRKEGMERKDVMAKNVGIFNSQGKALSDHASPNVKCLVVGNPANTNAAILSAAAPAIPKENITALTRLDHNRAQSLAAAKVGVPCDQVEGVIIWGNHSSTQYPDVRHAKTTEGIKVMDKVDHAYLEGEFLSTIQKRGAAVIAARKLSSAASAAKAICDHLRDWALGSDGRVVSMAIYSDGSHYGAPAGVYYSMPVVCTAGSYKIVEGLPIDDFSRGMMDATGAELAEELVLAQELLK
mmetsp:Transcript_3108/g.9813  ORF Transcript_3108/g.9813 Transcript_3108/m.9813 type:complete len:328 (-) Transcript_3108:373-1356(-)